MLVVDVETTGLDPIKCSIVSIGALDFTHPANQFYGECLVWKGARIDQKALGINGFQRHEIQQGDKQSEKSLIKSFLIWARRLRIQVIAGLNPAFDRDFLKSAFSRYNILYPFGHHTLDLHSICFTHHLQRDIFPPLYNCISALHTNQIHTYCGLPHEPTPHHGLTGAKMEAESLSRLVYGKNLLEEYSKYPLPQYLQRDRKTSSS